MREEGQVLSQQQGGTEGGEVTATEATTESAGQGSWFDSLPADHHETLKGFESVEAMMAALKGPDIPESYTVPEGVTIDQEVFSEFAEIAKEAKLPQEVVDKIISLDVKRNEALQEQMIKARDTEFKEGLSKLETTLGNAKYQEMVADAKLAINKLSDDELDAWFEETRLGNAPQLVKIFAKVGALLKEDTGLSGQTAPADVPIEKRMFKNMA